MALTEQAQATIASGVAMMGLDVPAMTHSGMYVAARRQARSMRQAGVHPDRIRAVVMESTVGWTALAVADLLGPEFAARRLAIEEGIARGLADGPRRALCPLSRRRGVDVQGAPIELADGQPWLFPELGLARSWWQDFSGVERAGYDWERTEHGGKAGRFLPRLVEAHAAFGRGDTSSNLVFREILAFCSAILRSNYRITGEECSQLMPVDVGDPSCMAEIVAVISGCERAEVKVLEVAAVAARFIKMLTAFQGYLYPLLGDYMALGNNDDCEESWAS